MFDKLDEQNKGYMKLGTFINGVQTLQNYTTNVTSTPPPPKPRNWGPNPNYMVWKGHVTACSYYMHLAFGSVFWYTTTSQRYTWICRCLYPTSVHDTTTVSRSVVIIHQACWILVIFVETPLAHVHLTSFGSENSNYVTADEVANVWNKLGIESTNEEVEHFIEVRGIYYHMEGKLGKVKFGKFSPSTFLVFPWHSKLPFLRD